MATTAIPTTRDAYTTHTASTCHVSTVRTSYRLLDDNRLFRSHLLTIDQHRRTTTLVQIPHLEDSHERLLTRCIQFAPLRYRLHILLLVTPQAPHEAHSPHNLAAEEIPLHPHKGLPTGPRDPTSVFMNTLIPLVSIPSKEFTYRNVLIIPPLHLNIPSNPQQVFALLDNWRTSLFKRGRIEIRDLPLKSLHFPINHRFT